VAASAAFGPILIVDDDLDDAGLAFRACQQVNPNLSVAVFGSGQELINYLQDPGSRLPSLILLDLKMPEMDGFAVMEWAAKRPQVANIPIVVLTNYTDLPHLKRAYALGARSFLMKPIQADGLHSALVSLSLVP
jgi:CheY-like chemotaxis protein